MPRPRGGDGQAGWPPRRVALRDIDEAVADYPAEGGRTFCSTSIATTTSACGACCTVSVTFRPGSRHLATSEFRCGTRCAS
jgi:hypothetical protein